MFKVLLAASPSFTDESLFKNTLDFLLSQRPNSELHYLTQKVFTKICNDYSKHNNHASKIQVRDFNMEGKETTQECYNRILNIIPDAAIVFWDGETYNEKALIGKLQNQSVKHKVIEFESERQQIKRMIEEQKKQPKRKKITVPLSKDAKRRYIEAHASWFKEKYPYAAKDGLYASPKILPINSGSRMDAFIVNFLVWSGWSATKINVMMKRGKQFIATGAKKGTFDLTATIKGRSIKIETKHCSDKPSEEQLKMQERERKAGAVAEFIYSIDEFFVLYDKILNEKL